jgi:hypothetical protein
VRAGRVASRCMEVSGNRVVFSVGLLSGLPVQSYRGHDVQSDKEPWICLSLLLYVFVGDCCCFLVHVKSSFCLKGCLRNCKEHAWLLNPACVGKSWDSMGLTLFQFQMSLVTGQLGFV